MSRALELARECGIVFADYGIDATEQQLEAFYFLSRQDGKAPEQKPVAEVVAFDGKYPSGIRWPELSHPPPIGTKLFLAPLALDALSIEPFHIGAIDRAIAQNETTAKKLGEKNNYDCMFYEGDAESLKQIRSWLAAATKETKR